MNQRPIPILFLMVQTSSFIWIRAHKINMGNRGWKRNIKGTVKIPAFFDSSWKLRNTFRIPATRTKCSSCLFGTLHCFLRMARPHTIIVIQRCLWKNVRDLLEPSPVFRTPLENIAMPAFRNWLTKRIALIIPSKVI